MQRSAVRQKHTIVLRTSFARSKLFSEAAAVWKGCVGPWVLQGIPHERLRQPWGWMLGIAGFDVLDALARNKQSHGAPLIPECSLLSRKRSCTHERAS